jgi:hypothetical protein
MFLCFWIKHFVFATPSDFSLAELNKYILFISLLLVLTGTSRVLKCSEGESGPTTLGVPQSALLFCAHGRWLLKRRWPDFGWLIQVEDMR